jgi:hypothetical protein
MVSFRGVALPRATAAAVPAEDPEALFRAADVSDFPQLASLTDRERVMWVLAVGKEKVGLVWMTPSQIAPVLRDVYGFPVPWQRVQAILAAEEGTIATSRKGGVRRHQIMQPGLDELLAKGPDVVFIEPTKALTGLRSAEVIMQSLNGVLRFCDPYVEAASLDLLAEATKTTEIRLLTVNIARPQVFARDLSAFRKEHGNKIEVRQAAPGTLHDRYAVDDARMLLFGTSLNGLGKKQSFIVELGQDVRTTVMAAFDSAWAAAKPV